MASAAPRLSPRHKLLATLRSWPHRYLGRRRVTTGLSIVVLALVPLLHLARFDAWAGTHWALGRRVDGVTGFGAVCVAIVGFYVITFVLNAAFGRLFCGWGCPIGQVSRLGEELHVAMQKKKARRAALIEALGYDALLAGAVLTWWVDPRVMWAGGVKAAASTVLAWLVLTGLVYLHGRYWQWRFCQTACPIGLYYTAVQTSHRFGIHFDRAGGACKECDACDRVCPVGLPPRDLGRPQKSAGGLSLDGMPAANHCLVCGDCVRMCENVFRKDDPTRVPLRLGFGADVTDTPGAVKPKDPFAWDELYDGPRAADAPTEPTPAAAPPATIPPDTDAPADTDDSAPTSHAA